MKLAFLIGGIALVAGAVAGVAAGAAVVHFYMPKQEPIRVAHQEANPVKVPILPVVEYAHQEPRRAPPTESADAPPAAPVEGQNEQHFTSGELAERWKAKWNARVESVQSEARDPVWASQAEFAFGNDFREKAPELGARLVRVECRTTGCLARVEWDSYDLAKARFRDLVHADYTTRCANSIDIGRVPDDRSRTHEATVVFQCERARTGDSGGG